MQGYRRFFFPIALATIIFQGCDKTDLYSGTGVSFNASSKGVDTKVSYGGTQNSLRAINWAQGDQISIYCQEAFDIKTSTYTVGSDITPDGTSSIAKGVVASGEPLKWNGDKDHNFYCVYPAVKSGVTTDVSNDGWIGSIPAIQQYNDGNYSDLSSYMMLVGYTKSKPQPKVDVDFYPVTTCLEFEMMNGTGYDLTVKEISLESSDTSPLSGDFAVSYNGGKTAYEAFETSKGATTGKTVTVTFGEEGRLFKKRENENGPKLSFKMFVNPADDITSPYLTIKAVRSDNVPIILRTQLKRKDSAVTFKKKHITPLTGILVEGGILLTSFGEPLLSEWIPDDEEELIIGDEYRYFLEVVDNNEKTLTFTDDGDGLKQTLKVKSYRLAKDGSKKTAIKPEVKLPSGFVERADIAGPDGNDIYTITFSAQQNTATQTESGSLSLSMKNKPEKKDYNLSVDGNTSNCYVVDAPGTYKFKLAYGNGIGYGGNYKGTPTGTGVDLLWTTSTDLIKDIEINNGYVTFTVGESTIQQGNALIALKNNSNTIVWSWHIWVTDEVVTKVPLGYYASGTCKATYSIPRELRGENSITIINPYDPLKAAKASITMKQGGEYKGISDKVVTSTGCTYYQWGRKDPFIYSDDIQQSNSKTDTYDLAQLIQNPTKFYLNNKDATSSGVDIINSHQSDFWGSGKTIFDPSPLGYKVAELNSTVSCDSITQAYIIRNTNSYSSMFQIEQGGSLMFWSCTSLDTHSDKVNAKCASATKVYSSAVTTFPTGYFTSKANAYCVMCVKE